MIRNNDGHFGEFGFLLHQTRKEMILSSILLCVVVCVIVYVIIKKVLKNLVKNKISGKQPFKVAIPKMSNDDDDDGYISP